MQEISEFGSRSHSACAAAAMPDRIMPPKKSKISRCWARASCGTKNIKPNKAVRNKRIRANLQENDKQFMASEDLSAQNHNNKHDFCSHGRAPAQFVQAVNGRVGP